MALAAELPTTTNATDAQATVFNLKGAPLLSAGRYDKVLGQENDFEVRVKVYAEGGENATHTHEKEDHLFFVLDGEAVFRLERDGEKEVHVKKNDGILLPAGAYYRFEATGAGNLVMLRVGSRQDGDNVRTGPDNEPLPGGSIANNHVPPVVVPGQFFDGE